jgi:hypothetical protein
MGACPAFIQKRGEEGEDDRGKQKPRQFPAGAIEEAHPPYYSSYCTGLMNFNKSRQALATPPNSLGPPVGGQVPHPQLGLVEPVLPGPALGNAAK